MQDTRFLQEQTEGTERRCKLRKRRRRGVKGEPRQEVGDDRYAGQPDLRGLSVFEKPLKRFDWLGNVRPPT